MSSTETGPRGVELAPLRAALKAMPAPAVDEATLRRMFREHRDGGRSEREPVRTRTSRSWALAAAFTGVAVAVGLAVLALTGVRREPASPATASRSPATVAAFQPLWYSPPVVAGAAYNVVRVRIPLSSLVLLPDPSADGMIEADLLVGEDGLARGIRFNGPGALLVSKASQ